MYIRLASFSAYKATDTAFCGLPGPASGCVYEGKRYAGSIITSKNYKCSVGSVIERAGKTDGHNWTLVRRCFRDLKEQEFLPRLWKQFLVEGATRYLYVRLFHLLNY
jgi:hypothetical protein